ncbi:uncharacterized protein EV154DRAFT_510145 [Mucor mucedo]|uniref:uncharacterized protein n=1 Tax=Mucor mucedo TaxID=29922 RepID=UPI00221FF004|nr:uncharacterized protein EV154DRAFT_510145 [Mucor mucedo]KAI7890777.1 hypothetical protein EV154DRAFT_510145 [Mucor mucedo]
MYLFDTNERRTTRHKRSKSKKLTNSAEAKAEAKAKKIQQDDMDALQITFYEIESWIEKTSPVLSRMTKELDKVSRHFDKKKGPPLIDNRQSFIQSLPNYTTSGEIERLDTQEHQDLSSMQWTLSFQPGNSMRLETNIKSVEQLIEAVQKIQIITESTEQPTNIFVPSLTNEDCDESEYASSSSSFSSIVVVDPSIEYWNNAMYRRPNTCSDKFKNPDLNLSKLTEDVSPSVLSYICQTYWDCLHPKFSADWPTFWNRSGDPERNQVCIDSGLAIIFLHIIRHNKNASEHAHDIAYHYFGRAREAMMDYFDSPDATTIETLLNLSMFCVLHKRHSQSRMYISLAYRMSIQLNIHQMSTLMTFNRLQRKKYLKLYLGLYYNDIAISTYSGEPPLLDDTVSDINFYDLLQLNKELVEHQEANYDDKTIAKESFYVYLLELAKIGKRIQSMTQDYQRQNLQHHHSGILPLRWIKKIQELEIALATWFDRLPVMYRVDPKPIRLFADIHKKEHDHHAVLDAAMLREQSGLLLMIQYQTQWIQLHKTFLSPNTNNFSSTLDLDDLSPPSPLETLPYRTHRSYQICTDAANRIVIMSEVITERFDWCVCQQFISCVYQASTVFCKSVINKDHAQKASKAMIQRITSVLAASKINYNGLPDDLTACLNDFLAENDILDEQKTVEMLGQIFSDSERSSHHVVFNDRMFNSPHMHQKCQSQQLAIKPTFTLNNGPPTEAMFSIKIENPDVVPVDLEPNHKNWRCKFSSSNIAQVEHRIM